ncbi:hypothetical protein ACWGDT_27470 [Streptomyces avermitilis]
MTGSVDERSAVQHVRPVRPRDMSRERGGALRGFLGRRRLAGVLDEHERLGALRDARGVAGRAGSGHVVSFSGRYSGLAGR